MAQTAAHLVDHVIPHVPVRQWVLSLPIQLRLLLAAQPKLVTPVLQVVHRVITRHLLGYAGLKADQADNGAVTLIKRFGSPGISHPNAAQRTPASVRRIDECTPSLKVFRLRSPFRRCAQFLPIVRLKLAPERLITSDSAPVDANREIVLDQ